MDKNKLNLLKLHANQRYLDQCCDLLNDFWPRSKTARFVQRLIWWFKSSFNLEDHLRTKLLKKKKVISNLISGLFWWLKLIILNLYSCLNDSISKGNYSHAGSWSNRLSRFGTFEKSTKSFSSNCIGYFEINKKW